MNKKDAAALVGVSERMIEMHAKAGRISVSYVRGPRGDVADYDERELKKLKAEVDRRRAARPAVTQDDPAPDPQTQALALRSALQPLEMLRQVLSLTPAGKSQPAADVGSKIMLSLPDAAALSSLSENYLRGAIRQGKLKAKIIGRGWKVKRVDLDAFVRKL